jgi:hypothetical protein
MRPSSNDEVCVGKPIGRPVDVHAGSQRRADGARIGAHLQRALLAGKAAGQRPPLT